MSSSSDDSGCGCLFLLLVVFAIWLITTQPWSTLAVDEPNWLEEHVNRFVVQNNPFPATPIDAVKKAYDGVETRSWSQYKNAFEPSALMEPEEPGTPGIFTDMEFMVIDNNQLEALVGVIGKWTPSELAGSRAKPFYIDQEITVVKAKKDILGSIEMGGGNKVSTGIGLGGWFVSSDQNDKLPFSFSAQGRGTLPPGLKGTFAFCQDASLMLSVSEKQEAEVLNDLTGCYNLQWTPNGQGIIFAQREDTSHDKRIDSADEERFYLLTLPDLHRHSVLPEISGVQLEGISPDSSWLIMSSTSIAKGEPMKKDLYLVAIDDGHAVTLTDGLTDANFLAWAPDSHGILLSAEVGTMASIEADGPASLDIYKINVPSASRKHLVGGLPHITKAQWAMDGKRIAFSASGMIYVVELDSGELIQPSRGLGECRGFAWVPNTSRLLLECVSSGMLGKDVWIANYDGGDSDLKRLTDGSGASSTAQCSPDGTHVAIVWNTEGGDAHVGIIGSDGGGKVLLQDDNLDSSSQPVDLQWSPNSTLLTFSHVDLLLGIRRLFVADISTGTVRRLTTASYYASSGWISDKTLFILRNRQEVGATKAYWAVQVIDVDTGAWRWQTSPAIRSSSVAWTITDHSEVLAHLSIEQEP